MAIVDQLILALKGSAFGCFQYPSSEVANAKAVEWLHRQLLESPSYGSS